VSAESEERAKRTGAWLQSMARRGAEARGCQLPDEPNYPIRCACGCGAVLSRFDDRGRPRAYVHGHDANPRPTQDAILTVLVGGPARLVELQRAGAGSEQVVYRALVDLRRKGVVRRVRRGWYALAYGAQRARGAQ